MLEEVRRAKLRSGHSPESLATCQALMLAYSLVPLELALGGLAVLAEELDRVTDIFTTNSHYCLHVLAFVDSLVQALVVVASSPYALAIV